MPDNNDNSSATSRPESCQSGSCLCGAVEWELTAPPLAHSWCHCSICRKLHGAAFGAYVAIPIDAFRFLSGRDHLTQYASSEGSLRSFCSSCGSVTPTIDADAMLALVPAGNLDGAPGRELDSHLFTADAACWFQIPSGAPQLPAFPPQFEGKPEPTVSRPSPEYNSISGSCHCGAVSFVAEHVTETMHHSHREVDRKACSAPFATYSYVPSWGFRWAWGESELKHFAVPEKDFEASFCRQCGGAMPVFDKRRDSWQIPAGAWDQDPGHRPLAHIHTDERVDWQPIADRLAQFATAPPTVEPIDPELDMMLKEIEASR
ncbi:MAG: GFA family protein [Pseudomonadota bacterium]